MTEAIASVIIPAHNEAAIIRDTLEALTDGVQHGALDIVVVCNGCDDDTARRASIGGADRGVRVATLDRPSKAAALNLGDTLTPVFPRIYLDADVSAPGAAVLEVARFLRSRDDPCAARPPFVYRTDDCDPLVRAYYRARSRTPGLMNAIWGAGFYALNRAGRALWREFPEQQADDMLVAATVGQQRLRIVGSRPVVVRPPRNTESLLRTLGRVHNSALTTIPSQRADGGSREETPLWRPRTLGTLAEVLSHNRGSLAEISDAIAYILISILARARSTLIASPSWARDDSTRSS